MAPQKRAAAHGMIYTGDGAFLPGYPARNLSAEEVAELGGIVEVRKTGLYSDPPADAQADLGPTPAPEATDGAQPSAAQE